ncbi:hypothetical protein [Clostridium coskatii]|uniref:Uncharacterized protein n=1 Tax=Clostridium coskatii TaxID=1705578 RepID=A0A168NFI8_9CLOT|nr:hypothetical protein [Clostridium coskatii]OAA86347.1 hypothetical protein WX73_02841 [Clostridium coskatii]OAA86365.1 hypothetical protein WX73_02859 [Clostridium coskatii]OBR95068.1 hypothetical protein CLCOS_17730 [Clostridium coskatii]
MRTIVENKGVAEIEQLVKYAIDSVTDYMKCKQYEQTERKRIQSCLQAITDQINSNRIKFDQYMKASFAERERLYSRVDKFLNYAIETGDSEFAKLSLNVMLQIYNKNPMDGIEDRLNSVNMNLLSQNTVKYL